MELTTCDKHISAEERDERESESAFSHGPQSANSTKGHIKSKHAMVVLKLLLQYNKEVNSNQTPTNFPPNKPKKKKKCKQENNSAYTCTASQIMSEGSHIQDQEILK